jgi:hypothetical protein
MTYPIKTNHYLFLQDQLICFARITISSLPFSDRLSLHRENECKINFTGTSDYHLKEILLSDVWRMK